MADEMSIPDLLGLNSPRGLLNVGSPDALYNLCTPPESPRSTMGNMDDARMQMGPLHSTPIKNLQRNWSLGSTGSSNWATPTQTPRAIRSISLSDSCESNPSTFNQHPLLNRSCSTYDSPNSYGTAGLSSSPDVLCNLLNSMTLSESLSKNLSPSGLSDVELSNLQNLQAINALKYLQQPPSLLNSFVPLSPQAGAQLLDKWNVNAGSLSPTTPEYYQLERAARVHRTAASVYDAVCTWSGVLPAQTIKPVGFSSKVFLGGVPWDITEQCLVQAFRPFGHVKVEWPGKERQVSQPKGYAYIVMESEKAVKSLLQHCTHDYLNSGNFYYKIGAKRTKTKDIQVIPWYLSDSNYTKSASQKLDPTKTVFVGALHGMLNAHGLAKVMNDLFDGVVYAGIDTDKYKYPIGSGRVTFNNSRSYMKAISTGFINIRTAKFSKKVQVDPYLEDSLCSFCGVQQGPYFCRNAVCFRYFCRPCWIYHHEWGLRNHTPMSRNSKNNQLALEFATNGTTF